MKKRILSILMVLVLFIAFTPVFQASAAVDSGTNKDDSVVANTGEEAKFSEWALNELVFGDTYGIYPLSWYDSDMSARISQGKLLIIIAGMRCKLLDTNCVTENPDVIYKTKKNMTVEEVLDTYYSLLTTMEFSSDLGFSNKSSMDNLKAIGIYKGTDGEPKLSDKCTIEEACAYATRIITYVYDKLDAGSKGFLWVAKSGGNTVYMLGSIHLASSDIYPVSKEMLDAYQSSDALVVELNAFDTAGAMSVTKLGMYSDGTTLKDHVSAETYQKVVTLAKKYGYTEAVISLFKPWYIDTMFSALSYTESGDEDEASKASGLGIDMNFMTNAYLYGKPILEIEGYKYQAEVLDSFSDELEEYLLNSTIDSLNDTLNGNENDTPQYLKFMLGLWHDGDAETFKEFSSEEDDSLDGSSMSTSEQALLDEYNNKLLTQRDLGMANYIDKLLKSEGSSTYFVVVGSAHYISDYSVLDILKERGYEITQIK